MKKLISLLLLCALLAGLALPAAAAQAPADETLAQVTQLVKQTLSLDTEAYDNFRGDWASQELADVWNLRWDSDEGGLYISALADGTILSYSLQDYTPTYSPSQSLPVFPEGDPDAARASAQAFLDRVLTPELESATVEESSGFNRLSSTSYRFSGTISLNGLPSPLRWSVTVRASDNTVTNFWRSAVQTSYLGEIPAADPKTGAEAAAATLASTQQLRLEYCLPEADSDTAVLCYLPEPVHEYYVDAVSGALVDLTALESGMMNGGTTNDSATAEESPAEAGGSLSEAEQEGIAQLEGVLSAAVLDQQLRAVADYGLTSYQLISSYFYIGEAEEEDAADPVSCTLYYSRAAGEKVYARIFTVDARSGEVQNLYSYLPWTEQDRPVLTQAQAETKAEAYLQALVPERAALLALYAAPDGSETNPDSYTFCYARMENGYFFPGQYYTVRIDATDGSVCGLNFNYDETIQFEDADGLISEDAALAAWMDTYSVTLGYLAVPQPLDLSDPAAQRLQQLGYSAYYQLRLGYTLERETPYWGIDAKSGAALGYDLTDETGALTYNDVAQHWSKTFVERLAQFGVGYEAESFLPDQALTQWDLICLLYSLQYYALNPAEATEYERDAAYAAAYAAGYLTRAERDDEAVLTRAQLVRYLLDGAGYAAVAQLQGIYTCDYPDRASIPESELGYAALAQGLRMISVEYAGADRTTRAEAATMLCRLMER